MDTTALLEARDRWDGLELANFDLEPPLLIAP
jgi:hypothetical protein